MVKEFDAQLQKGENPGAWTCVVMDDWRSYSARAGGIG